MLFCLFKLSSCNQSNDGSVSHQNGSPAAQESCWGWIPSLLPLEIQLGRGGCSHLHAWPSASVILTASSGQWASCLHLSVPPCFSFLPPLHVGRQILKSILLVSFLPLPLPVPLTPSSSLTITPRTDLFLLTARWLFKAQNLSETCSDTMLPGFSIISVAPVHASSLGSFCPSLWNSRASCRTIIYVKSQMWKHFNNKLTALFSARTTPVTE